MIKEKSRLDKIIRGIKKTAKELNIEPYDVTKMQFFEHTEDCTPWDLRIFGGLSTIKNSYFPQKDKELAIISQEKEVTRYVNKLEKQLSSKELFEKQIIDQISSNFEPIKTSSYKPKKITNIIDREVVVSINDTHYGLIVKPEEVSGANSFSWQEACRRTAMLAEQVLDYKIEKRDQTKRLHIILNGDIIQGVIHDLTARTAELLVHQINGAAHILGNFILVVSKGYPEVVVHAVGGNHEDAVHRRESGGRVTSHKYDSYANLVYFTLSAMFRNNKSITFNMTKGLSLDVNLPAGRLLVTHGDTLFGSALGNPSTNLQTRRIGDAINRYNAGEIARGKPPIKMVMMGHVHSYADFVTFDGTRVLIAPSMSGVDSYATSLGINFNTVGQVLFESTKEHIAGDSRLIELTTADKQSKYDEIIPVFTNELSWKS